MVVPPHERSLILSTLRSIGDSVTPSNPVEVFNGELHGQQVEYGSPGEFDANGLSDELRDFPEASPIPYLEESLLGEIRRFSSVAPDHDGGILDSFSSSSDLVSLFSEFQESTHLVRKISSGVLGSDAGVDDIKESRNQLALTQEETRIWNEIAALAAHPQEASTTLALADLMQRSQVLSEGYERRSKPPSPETHLEIRMLLEAMGVPCIESREPYEAEGLASALVRQGLAQLVASEDTVSFTLSLYF